MTPEQKTQLLTWLEEKSDGLTHAPTYYNHEEAIAWGTGVAAAYYKFVEMFGMDDDGKQVAPKS